MNFTPEELEEDINNEKEFLEYFEQKNIETLDQFAGDKNFNSLSDCFLLKQNIAMPRIGLTYYSKSSASDALANQIINKYKLLFGKWAKYDVDKKKFLK